MSENDPSKILVDDSRVTLQIVASLTDDSSGLYYKPMTIVNDDSRVVNKLETSVTHDDRVVIYDRHVFIVQATEVSFMIVICL